MQKYFNFVQDLFGNAQVGASVTVTNSAGTPTIYSDDGVTVKTNPLTTDDEGMFFFYAADGKYNLFITGRGIEDQTINDVELNDSVDAAADTSYTPDVTGGVETTVRDKLGESISVKDFGAIGDGSTDDYGC
jgi:hypothetical protein